MSSQSIVRSCMLSRSREVFGFNRIRSTSTSQPVPVDRSQPTIARRSQPTGFAYFSFLLLLALSASRVHAQTLQPPTTSDRPSALKTVIAMETLIVDAIEKNERSVAAIARVRLVQATLRIGDAEPGVPNGGSQWLEGPQPTDPDFVPNEYGTGLVVSQDGFILTAAHVLGDVKKNRYFVWIDRKPYQAKVHAIDSWMDMALLKIEARDLTPIKIPAAPQVRRGQFVIALGNPFAIARDGKPSASWGIVSNLSRRAPPRQPKTSTQQPSTLFQYGSLIHADIRLPQGTSGGALLNVHGELIGMTISLTALKGKAQGAGFAVPTDEAFRRAVQQLKAGRPPEYGFLGVEPSTLPVNDRQRGQHGVLVSNVLRGTPASRAGLLRGDLITHVAARPIYSPADLIYELSKLPVESRVELTVAQTSLRRGGKVTVVLGKKYIPAATESEVDSRKQFRGISVDYPTSIPTNVLARRATKIDESGCVVVADVDPNSPAWEAGLRPYDFVTHIDGKRVQRPSDFFSAVDNRTGPITLKITEIRNGRAAVVVEP